MIEAVWEMGSAGEDHWETDPTRTSDVKTRTFKGNLYKLYPWRHTILFDVIPVLETLAPFLIYFIARSSKSSGNNATPRPAFQPYQRPAATVRTNRRPAA